MLSGQIQATAQFMQLQTVLKSCNEMVITLYGIFIFLLLKLKLLHYFQASSLKRVFMFLNEQLNSALTQCFGKLTHFLMLQGWL